MADARKPCTNAPACVNTLKVNAKFCPLCGTAQTAPTAAAAKAPAVKADSPRAVAAVAPSSSTSLSSSPSPSPPVAPKPRVAPAVAAETALPGRRSAAAPTSSSWVKVAKPTPAPPQHQCTNCLSLSAAAPAPCQLCARAVCASCSRGALCNVCCAPGSWSAKRVAAIRSLEAAHAAYIGNRLSDALNELRTAIGVNPQDAAAYTLRALVHAQSGLAERAAADATLAVELGDTHVPALCVRMALHWDAGRAELARADAERLVAAQEALHGSFKPILRFPSCFALLVLAGPGPCRAMCDNVLDHASLVTDVERAEIHLLRATLCLRAADWSGAAADAHAVLQERSVPVFAPRAWLLLGRALLGRGLYREAGAHFARVESAALHDDAQLYAAVAAVLADNGRVANPPPALPPPPVVERFVRAAADSLAENARDVLAGNCLRALFRIDATAQRHLPESRAASLMRALKVLALKQGSDAGAAHIHHAGHVPVTVRLCAPRTTLCVRVPPQSSVAAMADLLRMMLPAAAATDGNAAAEPQFFDLRDGVWLAADAHIAAAYESALLWLAPPPPGDAADVELVIVDADRMPLVAARFADSVCALDVLRHVAACTGRGPLGFGLRTLADGDDGVWLLPSDSLASLAGRSMALQHCVTPCAAAMLVANGTVFNHLSDCAVRLARDGSVLSWGPGLGKFGYQPMQTPVRLEAFDGEVALAVAAGISHVCAVNADLQIIVAGAGVDKVDLPPQLNANVVAVACGFHFSVALTDDGRVCAWGSSSTDGQLGAITKSAGATQIDIPEKVVSVGCGYAFGVCVSVTGQLYAWGARTVVGRSRNAHHHLPERVELPARARVATVACGVHHVLALTTDGELYGFGVNDSGQVHPSKNGVVTSARENDRGIFYTPVLVRDRVPQPMRSRILCGEYHSMLCVYGEEESGTCEVSIWGDNKNGLMGTRATGTTTATHSFAHVQRITCGQAHVEVELSDEEALCWGKAPHLLIEVAPEPVLVQRFWLAQSLAQPQTAEQLWETARAYHERYDIASYQGRLDLSSQGLLTLPPGVVDHFTGITELDLSGNHFVCPPAELRRFANLKTVNLSGAPRPMAEVLNEMRDIDRLQMGSVWAQLLLAIHLSDGGAHGALLRRLSGGLAFESDRARLDDAADGGVTVGTWQSPDDDAIEFRAFVHGASHDAGAVAARSLFAAASAAVHVLVNRSADEARAFRRWLDARVGPHTPLVLLIDDSNEEGAPERGAAGEPFETIHVNSSTGLNIPFLLQRVVQLGRAAGLVEFPVPRAYALLCRAIRSSFAQGVLCVDSLARLCSACHVDSCAGGLAAARDFLIAHGVVVLLADDMACDPVWVGRELCDAAAGAVFVDDTLAAVLVANRLMEPSAAPFATLPAALDAPLQSARADHCSVCALAAPVPPCLVVCALALAGLGAGGCSVAAAQTGVCLTAADEVVCVTCAATPDEWTILSQSPAGSASSRLYALAIAELDALSVSLFGAPPTRHVVCPLCRVERRPAPGRLAADAQCCRAWKAGQTALVCPARADHTLALRTLVPEVRLAFTPRLSVVRTRGGGVRLGAEPVAVRAVDMERKARFSRAAEDPWQTLYLLSTLRHANLVNVLGVCVHERPMLLVTQLVADSDSLERVTLALCERGAGPDTALQLRIARDVARAMAYLHEHGVAHAAGLRPNCIFVHLSGPVAARVAVPVDALDDDAEAWRYQPPEQLRGDCAAPGRAGDLYAFGMLLFALAAAGAYAAWKLPFGRKASEHEWRREQKVDQICGKDALRPALPSATDPTMSAIAFRCWEAEPGRRGTFARIAQELEAVAVDAPPSPTAASAAAAAAAAPALTRNDSAQRVMPLARSNSGSTGSGGAVGAPVTKTLCDAGHAILAVALVAARYLWISTAAARILVFDLSTETMVTDTAVVQAEPPVVMQTLRWVAATGAVWGGGIDGTLFVWRKPGVRPLRAREHSNAITAICAVRDDCVVSADLTGVLLLWHASSSELRRQRDGPVLAAPQPVRSLELVARGAQLLVGLAGSAVVFDALSWTPAATFAAPGLSSIANVLLCDAQLWCAGGSSLFVFDYATRALLKEHRNVSKSKLVALLQLAGRRCVPVTVSVTSVVDLWDPATLALRASLADAKLPGTFNSLAFAVGKDTIVIARDSFVIVQKFAL